MATPAPPLFAKLFDDAAVFPPGNFSLTEALQRRADRTGTPDAAYVGPLLLPPPLVNPALTQPEPLLVGVVSRPGSPLADIIAAATAVAEHNWHSLACVQAGHVAGWRELLAFGVPVAVEVPAGPAGIALLDELSDNPQVCAKLRTGSTPATPVPSPEQLAAFVRACVDRGLGFKLTGGMHHAITHDTDQERQFGFLNVLVAVDAALDGADVAALSGILDERDTAAVVDRIRAIDGTRVEPIRDLFQSYGCCDVDDPIGDLRSLQLIEETA